jgi:hypothetical protein
MSLLPLCRPITSVQTRCTFVLLTKVTLPSRLIQLSKFFIDTAKSYTTEIMPPSTTQWSVIAELADPPS